MLTLFVAMYTVSVTNTDSGTLCPNTPFQVSFSADDSNILYPGDIQTPSLAPNATFVTSIQFLNILFICAFGYFLIGQRCYVWHIR